MGGKVTWWGIADELKRREGGDPIGILTRHSGSVRVQTRGLSERVTLCVRAWLTNRSACV
jgi:hypothetical protein